MNWAGKTVLITGGTGYLGQHLCAYLGDKAGKVMCYARDPHKHEQMQRSHPHVRPFVGDVRDYQRLKMAMEGADICVHAAAMKSVPMCEYNPIDAHSINVMGTLNVLNVARKYATRTIFISTDKAVEPINLYGKTKALAEHMTLAYNSCAPGLCSAVRYGNVMGSSGSVVPFWRSIPEGAALPITNTDMTRYWVEMHEAVGLIEAALENPGGLVVGDHAAFRLVDLAHVMEEEKGGGLEDIGIRRGEKRHEVLIGGQEFWNWPDHERRASNDGEYLSKEQIRERLHTLYEARPGDERGRGGGPVRATVLTPNTRTTN